MMQTQEEKKSRQGKKRWLLLLLLLLMLLTLATCSQSLLSRREDPADDPAVPALAPSQGDAATAPGGGTVSLTYSDAVDIDLSDKAAGLLFANPEKSGWDAEVQLVIGEAVLARSQRLSPGQQVTRLPLSSGGEKKLSPGSCEGKLLVAFYHRQSGQQAMLNTEIPVSVTVTD